MACCEDIYEIFDANYNYCLNKTIYTRSNKAISESNEVIFSQTLPYEISPGISVSCGDERERYFYTGSERTDQKCHEKSRVTDLV